MPLYSYKCPACGEQFDLLKKLREADEPITHCGGKPMERMPTAAAFSVGGFSAKNGYGSAVGK